MKTLTNILIALALNILLFSNSLFSQLTQQWAVNENGYSTFFNPSPSERTIRDQQGNIILILNDTVKKYSQSGSIMWSHNVAGALYAITLDQNDNVIITGTHQFSNSSSESITIKYNSSGQQQWFKTKSGGTNYTYSGYSISGDNNGNTYVLIGTFFLPQLESWGRKIIKYDASGNEIWIKNAINNLCNKITCDRAGNIIESGTSYGYNFTNPRYEITKYDSAGSYLWYNVNDSLGYLSNLTIDLADNIYLTGAAGTIKYNENGVKLWTSAVGFTPSSLACDNTGGVYLTGTKANDLFTMKLNATGNVVWTQFYNGPGNGTDAGYNIKVPTNGSGVFVCGKSSELSGNADFIALKFTQNGGLEYTVKYNGTWRGDDAAINIFPDNSGFVVSGITQESSNSFDLTVIKYVDITGISSNTNETPGKFSLSQNYPNPFNPATKINFSISKQSPVKLAVYDIAGKEVETLVNENLNSGSYNISWNASHYSSGVYFYKLTAGSFTDTKKMILTK